MPGARFSSRTAAIPGAWGITRQSYEEIDTLIRSLKQGSREFQSAMDVAAQLLAKTTQGIVQKYYRGFVISPQEARKQKAQRGVLPIRRITGRTYQGWQVRKIAPGIWEVFNEERGAYMVEYGIVKGGNGVRRPVLKMSAVATLRFVQRTRFGERIMAETFGNLRNNKGHFQSFSARMRGSNLLGVVGPTGTLP